MKPRNSTHCLFCGLTEGIRGRNGKPVHINREGFCAPCYTVLEKARANPEKLSVDDKRWFDWMCEFNFKNGGFVPIKKRHELRAKQPWACKRCGSTDVIYRDDRYINYCKSCADEARKRRRDD